MAFDVIGITSVFEMNPNTFQEKVMSMDLLINVCTIDNINDFDYLSFYLGERVSYYQNWQVGHTEEEEEEDLEDQYAEWINK